MFNFLKSKPQKPKTLGQLGEEFAQGQYKKQGYEILTANFFNKKGKRLGEIDFVAKNKEKLVFVEVKTRTALSSEKFGTAAEAVNAFKQQKILRAVKVFLLGNRQYQNLRPQIDVCTVSFSELDKPSFSAIIIPNAVEDWS